MIQGNINEIIQVTVAVTSIAVISMSFWVYAVFRIFKQKEWAKYPANSLSSIYVIVTIGGGVLREENGEIAIFSSSQEAHYECIDGDIITKCSNLSGEIKGELLIQINR